MAPRVASVPGSGSKQPSSLDYGVDPYTKVFKGIAGNQQPTVRSIRASRPGHRQPKRPRPAASVALAGHYAADAGDGEPGSDDDYEPGYDPNDYQEGLTAWGQRMAVRDKELQKNCPELVGQLFGNVPLASTEHEKNCGRPEAGWGGRTPAALTVWRGTINFQVSYFRVS